MRPMLQISASSVWETKAKNGLTRVTESYVYRSSIITACRARADRSGLFCARRNAPRHLRGVAQRTTSHAIVQRRIPTRKLLHLDEGFARGAQNAPAWPQPRRADVSLLFIVISRRRIAKSRPEWTSLPGAHCFSLLLTMEGVGNAGEYSRSRERGRPTVLRARATPPRSAAGRAAAASGRPTAA